MIWYIINWAKWGLYLHKLGSRIPLKYYTKYTLSSDKSFIDWTEYSK